MHYELPYFGEINLDNLKEDYRTKARIAELQISLDLNFENKSIIAEKAEKIKQFLENISQMDKQHHPAIDKDFKEQKGETADYIRFYLEELDEEELRNIAGDYKNKSDLESRLLNKLKLVRVGLYPDGKYGTTHFGIFDYSIDIDGEPCNQLLVLCTDDDGNINKITWES
ncbi:DUF2004 domain-containing protein [Chitinophaga sp. 212800010-3]|uniref:DUF2004 domain-containing protein n=1 Tax=unclassified Chitinophaga TaxID=2619133 RepID=UPI002DF5F2BA|nr:DUF2004 domain-containing protein [Chitinophaga sp. 212800010-3]